MAEVVREVQRRLREDEGEKEEIMALWMRVADDLDKHADSLEDGPEAEAYRDAARRMRSELALWALGKDEQ